MGQCTECRHYDSRPQGGDAVCKTVGVSGMYAKNARSPKGPCKPEGVLFSDKCSPANGMEVEIAMLREQLAATQECLVYERTRIVDLIDRAEAAEAKLRELSEQEPYCYGCTPPDKEVEEYLDVSYSPVENLESKGWKIIALYAAPKPGEKE